MQNSQEGIANPIEETVFPPDVIIVEAEPIVQPDAKPETIIPPIAEAVIAPELAFTFEEDETPVPVQVAPPIAQNNNEPVVQHPVPSFNFEAEFSDINNNEVLKSLGFSIKDKDSTKTVISTLLEDNIKLNGLLTEYNDIDPILLGANKLLREGGSFEDVQEYMSPNSWTSKDAEGNYTKDDESAIKAYYKKLYPKLSNEGLEAKIDKLLGADNEVDFYDTADKARTYLSEQDKSNKEGLIAKAGEKYKAQQEADRKQQEANKEFSSNLENSLRKTFTEAVDNRIIGNLKLPATEANVNLIKTIDAIAQKQVSSPFGINGLFLDAKGNFKQELYPILRNLIIDASNEIPAETKKAFHKAIDNHIKMTKFKDSINVENKGNDKLNESNRTMHEISNRDEARSAFGSFVNGAM